MREVYNNLADMFRPVLSLPYGDKMVHFVAFGLVGLIAFLLPRLSVVSIVVVATALGAACEIAWDFFGISKMDPWDVAADFAGGLFFGLLAMLVVGIPFFV